MFPMCDPVCAVFYNKVSLFVHVPELPEKDILNVVV